MPKKNPAAVSLGKLGGLARAKALTPEERTASARKAGKAKLTSMTPEQRREIAKLAAKARWAKKEKE